jgi:hypothetical protein
VGPAGDRSALLAARAAPRARRATPRRAPARRADHGRDDEAGGAEDVRERPPERRVLGVERLTDVDRVREAPELETRGLDLLRLVPLDGEAVQRTQQRPLETLLASA